MINIARIRYITSHFNMLKGLTIVPWGVYYLLGAVFPVWGEASSLNEGVQSAILLAGIILASIAHWLLFRYYGRTFGFVGEPTRRQKTALTRDTRYRYIGLWTGFVVVSVVVGSLAVWGSRIIDPQFSSMFMFRLLCAIVLSLLCLTMWLQERIKENYAHIPVWPLAVYLIVTLEPPAFWRMGATAAMEDVIIGLLFIFAGVYNHLLLIGSFQPIRGEKGSEVVHGRHI